MNERMLELYRQAQVSHTAIDPSNNMPYETTCFSAEKFAELIVQECVEKCKTNWYGDSLDDICKQMKEHFGVKE